MTNDELLARPRFDLSGKAELLHLNIRKEGPDDAKILMVDCKLSVMRVPGAELCRYFEPHLLLFLWRDDVIDGEPVLVVRNPRLAPVEFLNELKGATVLISGLTFLGAGVKRFSLQPHDRGLVTVTCSVTLHAPLADDVAVLAKYVQDEVSVMINASPDLFDGDEGAKAAKGGKKAPSAKQAAESLLSMAVADGATVTVEANPNTPLGAAVLEAAGLPRHADHDPLLPNARELVRKENRASISLVQRHLKVGYGRASKLLEALERQGVVSALDPKGLREVLPISTEHMREVQPLSPGAAWPFPTGKQPAPSPEELVALDAAREQRRDDQPGA